MKNPHQPLNFERWLKPIESLLRCLVISAVLVGWTYFVWPENIIVDNLGGFIAYWVVALLFIGFMVREYIVSRKKLASAKSFSDRKNGFGKDAGEGGDGEGGER